jgi:hypothetical protein
MKACACYQVINVFDKATKEVQREKDMDDVTGPIKNSINYPDDH